MPCSLKAQLKGIDLDHLDFASIGSDVSVLGSVIFATDTQLVVDVPSTLSIGVDKGVSEG